MKNAKDVDIAVPFDQISNPIVPIKKNPHVLLWNCVAVPDLRKLR